VISYSGSAESFAEIYWEDKLMPFIGGHPEANEDIPRQGIITSGEEIYRCPSDVSLRKPFINEEGQIDGIEHRTSYLMNSLLSHNSRRYGHWTLIRFGLEVGLSNFAAFSERNPLPFTPPTDNDPRQDDYDIWLGTATFEPWIADDRHNGAANYLYLDGHAATKQWIGALPDMYPDRKVLNFDGSYP
jgi:prepilin-type processing-associated H-X9-DG protein